MTAKRREAVGRGLERRLGGASKRVLMPVVTSVASSAGAYAGRRAAVVIQDAMLQRLQRVSCAELDEAAAETDEAPAETDEAPAAAETDEAAAAAETSTDGASGRDGAERSNRAASAAQRAHQREERARRRTQRQQSASH